MGLAAELAIDIFEYIANRLAGKEIRRKHYILQALLWTAVSCFGTVRLPWHITGSSTMLSTVPHLRSLIQLGA